MSELADRLYRPVMRAIAGFTLLLLILPAIVVLIVSFTAGSTLKFPPPGLSLRWYRELALSPDIIDPALTSLKVAAISTLLCILLGTGAALALSRSRSRLARLLDGLFMSPMVLPAMAFGLALLLVFNMAGIRLSLLTLVLGHTIVCTPFVIRMVSAAAAQLDPRLEQASASLGAGAFYTLTRVTLPLVRRGMIAGGFVAFLSSFDNVPISLFLADARTEVLPIKLWALLEGTLDVRVAAVSGVIVGVTLAGLLVAERLGGTRTLTGNDRG